ncbi:hypothetical protein [Noviherbaspirillum saxi]|uniref:Tellurite resistance protein n=1 Tax=Noviherbaspirillum saxi TaxID=2320863 RepID=A0A3A3G7N4_9BURK|nr:hypothetical protein [Noviherbaspirillum saxi]RJF96190.1 hypothetical protein D3871_22990 [Noviherbaspirillum saxi]
MDKDPPRARLYYLFGTGQQPQSRSWLERLPAGLFGISVGLFGLTGAWQRAAASGWEIAAKASELLLWVAAATWILSLLLYACKCKRYPQAVLQEARHPVQGSLQALIPISILLAVVLFSRPDQGVWLVLVLAALALDALIGWRVISVLATGQLPRNAITPALYLPIVGGALVGSMALASLRLHGWAVILFGIGLSGWSVLEARVLTQLFEGRMPEAVRPTIGIELAPPVIATLAASMVWPSLPGDVLIVGLGVAVMPFATVMARFRWWSGAPFSIGFWSFSFPLAALASTVLEVVQRSALPQWIGALSLAFATAVIVWLAVRTLALLVKGRLAP